MMEADTPSIFSSSPRNPAVRKWSRHSSKLALARGDVCSFFIPYLEILRMIP
jgi:hypothetical protein